MSKSIRPLFALCALASLGAATGCARTATFAVTRPAMLNAAAVGNTMTVAGIAAPTGMPQDVQAAAEIVADLQQRIANSLNRSIRLLPAGGGVVITGQVIANQYGERLQQISATCYRSVTVYVNGQATTQSQGYPCSRQQRIGTAAARLEFTVTHGQTTQVIFDQTYEDAATVTTSASDDRSSAPPIDGFGMLHNLRAGLTNRFARVILPYQENVTVEFEDCDGDARCRQGYDLVQAGNLAAAEPLFTAVVGQYQNPGLPIPPNLAERIGEALYNRGLARSYMGRYSVAVADITRAIAIRPNETDWQAELQSAQRMAHDQEALRQQGAVSNETQNVQQAGTP